MPFADNKGARIYYEVEGKGPSLVLVHGHSMGIAMWRHLGYVAALKDDHQVIMIDLRGHGQSDKPSIADDCLPRPLANDVLAVLDDVGIDKAHYFGHSVGAAIGLVLAAQSGQRFLSMVLGSCSPFNMRPKERQMWVQMHAVATAGLERMVKSMEKYDAISPTVKAHILSNDRGSMVTWMEGTGRWPDMLPLLPAISLPCLVYAGDRDPQYEGARDGAALMSNATLVTVPGVGHLGVFLRSDLVLPHVRAFLAKVNAYSMEPG